MKVAVYRGKGTGDATRKGIEAFLEQKGFDWTRVGAGQVAGLTNDRFDAFYVPGGWAWPYIRDIPPAGKEALRAFVAQGGSYIGVCAGAYFAADLIKWQGRFVEYDLDLFRGVAEGPIDPIEPWYGWKLTELSLEEHPIHGGESAHMATYWGGPEFDVHPDQPVTVLARYETTGGIAALTFSYGRGQVLLMGCHLELGVYPKGRLDRRGGHGAQWDWLDRAVRWCVAQSRERAHELSG